MTMKLKFKNPRRMEKFGEGLEKEGTVKSLLWGNQRPFI